MNGSDQSAVISRDNEQTWIKVALCSTCWRCLISVGSTDLNSSLEFHIDSSFPTGVIHSVCERTCVAFKFGTNKIKLNFIPGD